MSRDHLRLVGSGEGPKPTSIIGTFTFARVGGELVVLHDDDRCTVPEAMVSIIQLIAPEIARIRGLDAEKDQIVNLRRFWPGDIGGDDLAAALAAEAAPEDALAELARSHPNFSPPGRG